MTLVQHIFTKIKNNNVPIIIAALLIIYNYAIVYDNFFGFSKLLLAVHIVYNILSLCVIFIHLYKIINHHLLLSALLFFYWFSSMVILITLIVLGLPKANYNLSLIVLFLLCVAAAILFKDFLQQVNCYLNHKLMKSTNVLTKEEIEKKIEDFKNRRLNREISSAEISNENETEIKTHKLPKQLTDLLEGFREIFGEDYDKIEPFDRK